MLNSSNSQLLVIDMQEKLAPHIHQTDVLTQNAALLMQTALELGVPVTVTEHYSAGLGATIVPLQGLLRQCRVFEKIHFSAANEPQILKHLRLNQRNDLILLGAEAHVCVMQTALGLLNSGFNVCIVDDASSSRMAFDRRVALKRLNARGVSSLTTEMLIFEWLERADTSAFKQALSRVKHNELHWHE